MLGWGGNAPSRENKNQSYKGPVGVKEKHPARHVSGSRLLRPDERGRGAGWREAGGLPAAGRKGLGTRSPPRRGGGRGRRSGGGWQIGPPASVRARFPPFDSCEW